MDGEPSGNISTVAPTELLVGRAQAPAPENIPVVLQATPTGSTGCPCIQEGEEIMISGWPRCCEVLWIISFQTRHRVLEAP